MTDEEIIEGMAEALFNCRIKYNEAPWPVRSPSGKKVWRHFARAAFAIASARIREQCAEEKRKLIEALRPLSNAVYNDNGDMTVSVPLIISDSEICIAAYFAIAAALRQPKANPDA